MHQVMLPELGEGITKATLACWHFHEGEYVTDEDDIAEVVTDKATFNVPAEKTGIVKKLMVQEGQEVSVGEVLVVIE